MSKFETQLNEIFDNGDHRVTVLESNLGRIVQHMSKNEYAVITAQRGDEDEDTNTKNYGKLKTDLTKLDLGWIPAIGFGQEKDEETGKVTSNEEPVFIVINKARSTREPIEGFKDKMLQLGKKYKQWGISYGTPNKFQIIRTDGSIGKVEDEYKGKSGLKTGINAFMKSMFQTRLRKGKKTKRHTFAFEGVATFPKPLSVMEMRIRNKHGEIYFDENSLLNSDTLNEMFYTDE